MTARLLLAACALVGAALLRPAPASATPASTLSIEDTVLAVRRGQTLIGEGISGRVRVEAWDQDRIQLIEEVGDRRIGLSEVGDQIRLVNAATTGRADRARRTGPFTLRVPAWLAVKLRGVSLQASVQGLDGSVELNTVEGNLSLIDVRGDAVANSVEGSVSAERSSGRLHLRSVNESVRVSNVNAESVVAATTSGDVDLEGVTAGAVDASTTEGDIRFDGTLKPDGSYRLATHDGSLDVALAADASAVVSVSTFDGEFRPQFPVTVDRFRGGKEISFTLGRGGARLTLAAFEGDIVLRRR